MQCHTPLPANSKFCLACGADVTDPTGAEAKKPREPITELANRLKRVLEGKYLIKDLLGRGGMGAVFLAEDLTLERQVAIKVLPPEMSHDEQLVGRFQREAKTAAKLDHPNIIPIYRVESEAGLNYFVMKFVTGRSLEDILEKEGPLTIPFVQRVLWEAAVALGHAHQRRVVHRDIKPGNIMFDHDGRVMLADFGISKAVQAATQFTGTGMIIGTPHYMAPEQAKGLQVDGRVDEYSLAVVGYRMLTGQLPFSGDSVHTILYKHIFEEAPLASTLRAEVPIHLGAAIAKALAKEPDQRYRTMEEFATAVWPEQPVSAPVTGGGATPGPRTPPPARAPVSISTAPTVSSAPTTPMPAGVGPARASKPAAAPPPKRSKAPVLIGVTVVAVGAGVAALMLTRSGPAPTSQSQQVTDTVRAPAVQTTRAADTPGTEVPREPRRETRQPERRRAQPESRAQAGPIDQAAEQQFASLSVDSDPFGTVYVDNVEIGSTPVVNHKLSLGRHEVRVEREGCKTKTERLDVTGPNPIRKRYVLECGGP